MPRSRVPQSSARAAFRPRNADRYERDEAEFARIASQASLSRDVLSPTPPGPEGSNGNGLLRVQWVTGAWLIFPLAIASHRNDSQALFCCEFNFTEPLQLYSQEIPCASVSSIRASIQGESGIMRKLSEKSVSPSITIRVAGSLSQGHLSYLDQLVASAIDCALWPLLDLANLEELDRVALMYLVGGEGREFGIVACPNFVREWMQHEKQRFAA
jgi:hypothetical protein